MFGYVKIKLYLCTVIKKGGNMKNKQIANYIGEVGGEIISMLYMTDFAREYMMAMRIGGAMNMAEIKDINFNRAMILLQSKLRKLGLSEEDINDVVNSTKKRYKSRHKLIPYKTLKEMLMPLR